jgi:hypothetical protein
MQFPSNITQCFYVNHIESDGCDRGYHQVTLFGTTFGRSAQVCPGCEVQVANGAEARTLTLGAASADGQACVVCCDPRDGSRMLLCDRCD